MPVKARERKDSFSIRVSPYKWAQWRKVAEASGKSMNRYVIQAVDEWTKYESINLREKQDREAAEGQ
jgi:predicted HicB family RNase H-like nuclease